MAAKRKPGKTRVIGLTGNIACGKSAVAGFLARRGVPVVDADQIARDAVLPGGEALRKIQDLFGPGILDSSGSLDREAMRTVVFADPDKRRQLESILHPEIQRESRLRLEELARAGHPLIVYEASLLVETGRHRDFDGLLVVTCEAALQRSRLLKRDPALSGELADRIIAAQMPPSRKRAEATWVLENDGTLEALDEKVRDWLRQFDVARPA